MFNSGLGPFLEELEMSNRNASFAVAAALVIAQLVTALAQWPDRPASPARGKRKAMPAPATWVSTTLPIGITPSVAAEAPPAGPIGPTPTAPPIGDAAPDPSLKVRHDPRLPAAVAINHRQISDLLNQARIGVPADRIRYFQPFAAENRTQLGNWHGAIEAVTPTEEGLVVDLAVTADSGRLHDSATLMERYLIANGRVIYIKSWKPANMVRCVVGA